MIFAGQELFGRALGFGSTTQTHFTKERRNLSSEHVQKSMPEARKNYDEHDYERFSDITYEHYTIICFPVRRY